MNVTLTLLDAREGGATFRPDGAPAPTEGWAVSRQGEEETIPVELFFGPAQLLHLASYVSAHLDELAADPELYVGVWVDEGQVYLDLTQVFPREQLPQAVSFGLANEQAAMFCLHDQQTWYLNTLRGREAAALEALKHDRVGQVVYGPVVAERYITSEFIVPARQEDEAHVH